MSGHSGLPLMAASCSPRSLGTDNWVALSFLATKHYYCTGTEQVKAFLSWLSGRRPLGRRGTWAGREGHRSPTASHGVAATVAAQIHREGPLPADKEADISPSETPAQGQRHKSWGGSKRASQPATPGRASFLPGPSRSAPAAWEPAWSIISSSASDPSITPAEEPPSRSTLAEATACSHLPRKLGA